MALPTTRRSAGSFAYDGGINGYIQAVRKVPMLRPDEEFDLAKRWREQGDPKAAQRLVASHLRLVVKVAMGYRNYGLPVGDLISEGNVGILQAVNRFEPDRGFRLATYAIWWIRAAIQEYILRTWSLVKIGTTSAQKTLFFNLRKLKARLQIMDDGDMSLENIEKIATALDVTSPDVVSMNRRLMAPDHSLNAPLSADGDGEWQDWLADERDNQEVTLAEQQQLSNRRKLLSRAIEGLNSRERHILVERRLKDEPTTLEMLSRTFGISRERVRQIEVRAFVKVAKTIRSGSVVVRTNAADLRGSM